MSTPYQSGRSNAGNTDAPPSYQTLKNSGLSDTKAAEFLQGYTDKKNGK